MTKVKRIIWDFSLKVIIDDFIKNSLKDNDWTVIAIDPIKDVVILKRYKETEDE